MVSASISCDAMPRQIGRSFKKGKAAMRVIFMGTPDFAVPALKALVAAGHEVLATYT
ncbi:MAG: methionyl-tRNA formyltransferase, partial [Novosphingobium sp.]